MTVRKRSWILASGLAFGILISATVSVNGQGTGVANKVGQKLDEVGRGVSRTIRNGFDMVRTEVGNMGVHSRVYSRLHWDKGLTDSKIEVQMHREGIVILRGTVADTQAKKHAAVLASETVGVTEVVDELIAISSDPVVPVSRNVPQAASRTSTVPRIR